MTFFSSGLPGLRLALISTLLAVVVVGLGAFTRLVDAGLGCPDWPGCYGHLLWPNEAQEIAEANAAFPDMPVDNSKTWPEMVHRYFAGALGLLILAMAIIAFKRRRENDYPYRQPMFMLFLVIWQALFGMWTVTLKLWPQVVSLHLMGGFATFVLLTTMVQRLSHYRWRVNEQSLYEFVRLKPWLITAIVVVAIQVSLGGWVASNYAAFGCPPKEFPACYGSYWPPMDFAQGFNLFQGIGPNYLGGLLDNESRTAIHFVHRLGALVTSLYLIGLALFCYRSGSRQLSKLTHLMLGLLLAQVILGINNVVLVLPLSNAVAHNLVGAFLLAAVSSMLTQTSRAES